MSAKVLSVIVAVCNLRCILAVNRHKPALPQQRLSWQSVEGDTADRRRSSATLAATNLCLYRWFSAHLRLILSDTRDFAQTFLFLYKHHSPHLEKVQTYKTFSYIVAMKRHLFSNFERLLPKTKEKRKCRASQYFHMFHINEQSRQD